MEICQREWVRIMTLKECHPLRKALTSEESFYNGREGSPLGYVKFISKELQTFLQDNNLDIKEVNKISPEIIEHQVVLKEQKIFSSVLGSSHNRSEEQIRTAKIEFDKFMETCVPTNSLLAFTDGSVMGSSCLGEGGYGVVLLKKVSGFEPLVFSGKVGSRVDNVKCELKGIIEALKLCVEKCVVDKSIKNVFLFSDCKSAIDIVCKQKSAQKNLEEMRIIWECGNFLCSENISMVVIWIPGHADILCNEMADKAAKEGALKQNLGNREAISEMGITTWIKECSRKRWQIMWRRSESGAWTKELLEDFGKKLVWPRDRDAGIAYVRALLNNAALSDNMYRMGFAESRECECGEGRETVEHILMQCSLESENREVLIKEIEELWMSTKQLGGLQVDLQLMLSPHTLKKWNVAQVNEVMKFVFKFLRKLRKKL